MNFRRHASAIFACAVLAFLVAIPAGTIASGASPDLSGGPSLVSVHFDSSPSPLKVTHGLLPSTRSIWLTVTL
ncbi:MAG: hypothetical protein WCA77_01295, partial [Thermoplasmata archaeon]